MGQNNSTIRCKKPFWKLGWEIMSHCKWCSCKISLEPGCIATHLMLRNLNLAWGPHVKYSPSICGGFFLIFSRQAFSREIFLLAEPRTRVALSKGLGIVGSWWKGYLQNWESGTPQWSKPFSCNLQLLITQLAQLSSYHGKYQRPHTPKLKSRLKGLFAPLHRIGNLGHQRSDQALFLQLPLVILAYIFDSSRKLSLS